MKKQTSYRYSVDSYKNDQRDNKQDMSDHRDINQNMCD